MTTLLNMLDDLRDRLDDASDTKVSKTTKIRFINYGINATWPLLYTTVQDSTLDYDVDTTEYALPSTVGVDTRVIRVEIENALASGRFIELDDYDFVGGRTDPALGLRFLSRFEDGSAIRVTAARRLANLAADADVFEGPPGTEELPVLYAMGCIAGRRVDPRTDYTRYKATQDVNGVGLADVMDSSQFWFAQFELLLDRMQLAPLPG